MNASHDNGSRRLWFGFVLGVFALGTSENVVGGILYQIAQGFGRDAAQMGLLVSAYAGSTVIAGPLLCWWGASRPPRLVCFLALALYAAGAMLAAFAPTFPLLVLARVLTGSMHTVIFVTFLLAAMHLARPGEEGRAIGRITLGFGLSVVLGVPFGTALAQHAGWPMAFVSIAILASAALLLVRRDFPLRFRHQQTGPGKASTRDSLRGLTRASVAGGIAMCALVSLGSLLPLAFVAVIFHEAGLPDTQMAPALLVYGAACVVGNTLGARFADFRLKSSVVWTLVLTLAALFVAWALAGSPWTAVAGIALIGFANFTSVPPVNTWVAMSSRDLEPSIALSVNSAGYNAGFALAGALGAALLSSGVRGATLMLVGAVPVAVATLLAVRLREPARR